MVLSGIAEIIPALILIGMIIFFLGLFMFIGGQTPLGMAFAIVGGILLIIGMTMIFLDISCTGQEFTGPEICRAFK